MSVFDEKMLERAQSLFGTSIGPKVMEAASAVQAGVPLSPFQAKILSMIGGGSAYSAPIIDFLQSVGLGGHVANNLAPKVQATMDTRHHFEARRALSVVEKEALEMYQGSAAINDHLRGLERRSISGKMSRIMETPAATRAYVHDLDRATRSQAATAPVTTWRGLYANPELRHRFRPGALYQEQGYQSTSFVRTISEGYIEGRKKQFALAGEDTAAHALLLKINVPKGYRVSAHLGQQQGVAGTQQAEVLFGRSAPIRILSESQQPNYTLIEARALRFARGRRLPIPLTTAAEAATPALLKDGLQQIHVNLESNTGQFFKRVMRLPFRKHSRLDPLAAATQAQSSVDAFQATRSLSVTELAASQEYMDAAPLNPLLRFGPEEWKKRYPSLSLPRAASTISTLDEAMSAHQTRAEVHTWRGFSPAAFPGGLPGVGDVFTEPGYTSTSVDRQRAAEFVRTQPAAVGPLAEVVIPEGSKALPFPAISQLPRGRAEGEVLLPRGTQFKVLKRWEEEGRPRLLLEALTSETRPPPVPIPHTGSTLETAAKIAAKETLAETHVNLESGIGKFLKKAMRLPFKGHSQVDPLAAATQAASSGPQLFGAASYTGILMGGVLALGAAITIGGWKRVSQSLEGQDQPGNWDYKVPSTHQANLHGGTEAFSINRAQIQSPDGTTDVQLDDAQLEHAGIDQAFSKHLKYGFAHSSR